MARCALTPRTPTRSVMLRAHSYMAQRHATRLKLLLADEIHRRSYACPKLYTGAEIAQHAKST